MSGSQHPPRSNSIWRAKGSSTNSSRSHGDGGSTPSRSSMTIWVSRPAAWWPDQASRGSWLPCAPGTLEPCCAWMPLGSRAMDATGITCSNCAGSSKRASLTSRGSYDPGRPNDRLLLGMKGSISEFELGILRARMLDAARAKARRGELRISVPIGYVWHRDLGLGFDPDLRIQEAIRQIFQRFRQLGSARSVHLAMSADQVHFPRPSEGQKLVTFDWAPIRYRNVISVLKNPFYAGFFSYGKSEKRTDFLPFRARTPFGHGRPLEEWEVLLKDHHEGYIDWGEFDRNQAQLASNAYGLVGGPKSGRGGSALLSGLLTCGRCGRRLAVAYTGRCSRRPVYRCDRPNLMLGRPRCLGFGGSRIEAAIAREVLLVVEPMAVEAALEAERRRMESRDERQRIADLELQQARYGASLAEPR